MASGTTSRFANGVYGIRLADGLTWTHAVTQLDAAGAVVTPGSAPPSALTDKSLTITLGGTAQQAIAANTSRHYLFIQNPSGSGGALWFSTTGTAVQASPSIELLPGASYENPPHLCPTGAVSVIHPTTSAKISIREA